MKIVVLGAAGLMGSGTVKDLLSPQSEGIDQVIAADIEKEQLSRLAKECPDERLETLPLSVTDKEQVIDLLKDADICINAVPTLVGLQMDIFHCCFDAGCDYVDYGGLGKYTVMQKAEHEKWEKAGLTAVISLGADPGMSNVTCKAVAEELDSIEKINLYWAGKLIGPENPVLVPPYSMLTILAEYGYNSKQFYNGELIDMPPLSGKEILDLPEPFGKLEFMHTIHSEQLTVPFSKGIKDKGIQEFTWRLNLPEREHETYLGLMKCGFDDFETPLKYKGVEIKPGEFLEKLIKRNIEKNSNKIPEQEGHEIHFAVASGIKDGEKTKATCTVTLSPNSFYNGYHDPATSMNASIGAQLIKRSEQISGVWAPEEYYNISEYFTELRKRYFKVSMEIKSEKRI